MALTEEQKQELQNLANSASRAVNDPSLKVSFSEDSVTLSSKKSGRSFLANAASYEMISIELNFIRSRARPLE